MRCESCDYPLWNLKARQCPECGAPFLPSEHEFVINSVRFCCQHCDQDYYGTAERGHLEPIEFDCVKCGEHLHMDDMVLRPTRGVSEERTQVDRMPWLERDRRGNVKAFFATVGQSMGLPHRLMNAVPEGASLGAAWMFLIVICLFVGIGGGGLTIGPFAILPFLRGGGSQGLVIALGLAVALPVILLVNVALWGAVTHGVLKVTGGARFSIGRTYQALCYSSGTMIGASVPCLAYVTWYIAVIWWIVSAVFMVAYGQRVSGGRAALAVLPYPLFVVVASFAMLMGFFMLAVSAVGTAGAFTSVASETNVMNSALVLYAEDHGDWPGHPVQLISDDYVAAVDFTSWSGFSPMDPSTIQLGDTDMQQFELLPMNRQDLKAQELADALPPNLVAQRVGDVVFTYFGVDPVEADPKLWIMVLAPQSSAMGGQGMPAPPPTAWQQVWVGRADGSVIDITGTVAQSLSEQNAVRAENGLPPLPDPTTLGPGQMQTSGEAGASSDPDS